MHPRSIPAALTDLSQGRGACRDEVGLVELFGGIGGARMALERLGIEVAVHTSAEILPEASRAARLRMPTCVEFGDVRNVDEAAIRGLLAKAPHLRVLIVIGGSPCQGVARINASGQGWAEERTRLVDHIPRAAAIVKRVAPEIRVLTLGENVSSMSPEDRERFSKALGSVPVQLCSGDSSPVRRPRLYWINWPLGAVTPELSWEAQPGVIMATLRGGYPFWADELERGARRPCGEDGPWATFVRSIPR